MYSFHQVLCHCVNQFNKFTKTYTFVKCIHVHLVNGEHFKNFRYGILVQLLNMLKKKKKVCQVIESVLSTQPHFPYLSEEKG